MRFYIETGHDFLRVEYTLKSEPLSPESLQEIEDLLKRIEQLKPNTDLKKHGNTIIKGREVVFSAGPFLSPVLSPVP
jgi:hypothetical protein